MVSLENAKRIMELETVFTRTQRLDSQVLALLHDQYYPVVYRYVAYRLDDALLCEDISSEVFLRLVEALHHRQVDIKDVRGWLLGTASHLVMDHWRGKYRQPVENLDDHEMLPDGGSLEKESEQAFHHEEVRQAISRLTAEQQHVLALRFSQDFSLEETARLMEKSVGAVKVLQFRALASLRRILGDLKINNE